MFYRQFQQHFNSPFHDPLKSESHTFLFHVCIEHVSAETKLSTKKFVRFLHLL